MIKNTKFSYKGYLILNINIMHSKALTLTELLLSAAILSFVLCGMLILFINSSFLNEANRNLTTAVAHAEYIMEEIRSEGTLADIKQKIDNGDFTSLDDLLNENISACCFNPPWVDYATSCLGSCQNDGGDPLGVDVVVQWADRRGRQRTFQIQTRMTDL